MSLELQLRQLVVGGSEEPVQVVGQTTMLGSLTSNQITLAGAGIEPIHGMIERLEDGELRITDLGTLAGIKVNGTRIAVETVLAEGDVIEVGPTRFRVTAQAPLAPSKTVKSDPKPRARGKTTVVSLDDFKTQALFNPKTPASKGRMLEVVAYWGDTVLNVDQFHPDVKGHETVTIGDPNKAHFISGGSEWFTSRVLANVESDGCVLKLTKGMSARVRQQGEVKKIVGLKQLHLGPSDYAHIQHGAVHYFLHYANQPQVELPRSRGMDNVSLVIAALATISYLVLVIMALTITPSPAPPDRPTDADFNPDIYKKVPKKPTKLQTQKPVVEIAVQKPKPPVAVKPTAQPKEPPKSKDVVKPLTPVKPQDVLKPVTAKPVSTPVNIQPTPTPTLQATPTAQAPQNASGNPSPTPAVNPGGAKSPSPKIAPNAADSLVAKGGPAGAKAPGKAGNSGGPGSPSAKAGGALKGATPFNQPGQDQGKLNQASMPNLSKLGAGLGKVMSTSGGTPVQFKDSAGGMGKKFGSSGKDYNLGGAGNGSALALPGSSNLASGFGAGPGGVLSGGNGPGGGLAGLKKGGNGPGLGAGGSKGHGRADVQLPPQAPGISDNAISAQEVLAVIRQHLNEIRHCYEQLLQRVPNASGKMTTEFAIGLEGRVVRVSVPSTTINDAVFRSCITGKIQRWTFPKPRNTTSPVTVTYPFVFSPL